MGTNGPVYALNLFDIVDREEYLAYSKRSAREVAAHGGKLVAPGRFRETQKGDITPRQVLILVESSSSIGTIVFEGPCSDVNASRQKDLKVKQESSV